MSELIPIKYAHYTYLSDAADINASIVAGFEQYKDAADTKKTHLFEGRYENVYIDREHIPALGRVIEQATKHVACILNMDASKLQCGFWFNSMQPGQVTIAHTHDDDDELMSGVYYIQVPENAGNLLLGVGENQACVEPEAGKMVFFSPALIHQVTENKSDQHRLSIGMNFGLKAEFKIE